MILNAGTSYGSPVWDFVSQVREVTAVDSRDALSAADTVVWLTAFDLVMRRPCA
jgi:hypothetical protein